MAEIFEEKEKTQYAYQTPALDAEALHRARSKEIYEMLKNAEDTQLLEYFGNTSPRASVAPVLEPERVKPQEAPAPRTEEPVSVPQTRRRADSTLFTPETLDRMIRQSGYGEEPAASAEATASAPVIGDMPVTAVNVENEQKSEQASYGLSGFAVKAIAAFSVTVVALMSVIGINSRTISNKKAKLRDLETRQEQLTEQKVEIERRIEEATSPETILRYAEEHGMVLGN